MPLQDYRHWNEDAHHMWWMEEGRHAGSHDVDDLDYRGPDLDEVTCAHGVTTYHWDDCDDCYAVGEWVG